MSGILVEINYSKMVTRFTRHLCPRLLAHHGWLTDDDIERLERLQEEFAEKGLRFITRQYDDQINYFMIFGSEKDYHKALMTNEVVYQIRKT